MTDDEILSLIDAAEPCEALSTLNGMIRQGCECDTVYYAMGRLYWRLGNHAEAVRAYRAAVAINPDSVARHALEMADDVFRFFNPDLLNP